MTGLFIFTSNRMELLVERLAELVQAPLSSVLSPEIILVQSRGMERWVAMNLARRNGICANVRFPFPNAFLEDTLCRLRPESDAFSGFGLDVMAFRIMKILLRSMDQPVFAHLKAYLQDDRSQLKLYPLCRKLADLFDQYSIFRADMLAGWAHGAAAPDPIQLWQSRLWRELVAEAPGVNRAQLLKDSLDSLDDMDAAAVHLPERVSLFGISYLPPLYLQTFEQLSRFTRVNLFLLNPCREYWADIISDQEVQRLERRHPHVAEKKEAFHLERGNRLLSSLGALGRDFFDWMATSAAEQQEFFEDPEAGTVLSHLQSDILNLRDREFVAGAEAPGARTDKSVCIHSCHSPLREIEVLHDQLLDMFEEDPELLPGDIVVMTPDIDAYAPYISAVFGPQGDHAAVIPFSIADWRGGGQSRLETALLKLLEFKGSRLGASEVLRLLEFEHIRRKFSITEADRGVIERWVRETGIRWGEDETSRMRLGLPACAQNTWKAGVERLLLGYAMPSEGTDLFRGVLPFDPMEGGETQILGNLLAFIDKVFELSRGLEQPKTLAQWKATFSRLLDDFLAVDEEMETEIRGLRQIVEELIRIEESVGFEHPVSLDVVRTFLTRRLEGERVGRGFLSGGVTFCAMLPMRTIPFKVVCLIGMNDNAFPREHPPLSFDLIGRHPRKGDRSRRNDDKYLFLEAVLAARSKLYISYVGQSQQDNSSRPPSVLVSELIDALQNGFHISSGGDGRGLVVEHRLQRFSREYFRRGSGLFSYSQEDFSACAASGRGRAPDPFFRCPLVMQPPEAAISRKITLDRLYAFLAHPARFVIRQRLGIHLEEAVNVLEECEPFQLEPLTRYRIGDTLLKHCLNGNDPQSLLPVFRAAGGMPHGRVGDYLFSQLSSEVRRFVSKAKSILPAPRATSLEFDADIDGFQLSVRLSELSERGCVQMRYADLTARDFIRWWLRHLGVCVGSPDPASLRSLLVGKDAAFVVGPVGQCRSVLSDLLRLYWQGLAEPVPFFPGPSLEYFRKLQTAQSSSRRALASARQRWAGTDQRPGESEDPYNRLCHGGGDPLYDAFQRLSVQVFQPLFANAEQLPW